MTNATFIDIILVGFGICLPFGVVKYLIREKYARQVLLRNETERDRTYKSNRAMLKWLRLFLYISPLILVLVPYFLYQDAQVDLLRSITLTVLMLVTVGLEYIFHKWLHNRLRSVAE